MTCSQNTPHSGKALRSCDKEPVHIPGRVQSYGVLLVLDPDSLAVLQAAGDTQRLLGRTWRDTIGKNALELFREDHADEVRALSRFVTDLPCEAQRLRPADAALPVLEATLHKSGNVYLLELDDPSLSRQLSSVWLQQFCCRAQDALLHAHRIPDLFQCIVGLIRELTGFDRVMLYQFHKDFSGEVIAEEKITELRPLKGHRYPASDIPEPARRLYLKNWLRLIPDVNVPQEALAPASHPLLGGPLDLTHSRLRAVSPMHIEYLKNMGVRASLSLSVLTQGELWGLLACHHYSGPMHFTAEIQTSLTILAQSFSMALSSLLARESYENRLAKERLVAQLHAKIKGVTPLELLFPHISKKLLDLVHAHGVALVHRGQISSRGRTPSAEEIRSIAKWFSAMKQDVHATSSLPAAFPDAESFKETAAGVLGLRVGGRTNTFFLWFRPELQVEERWGGDPSTPYTYDPDSGQINPRASFETYKRLVKGSCAPWTEHDLFAVEGLIPLLNAHIIRITESLVRQNEKVLREKNEQLEKMTQTDALTGVTNRRFLFERLDKELHRAKRYGTAISIAMLDIDRFKSVNDTFGHQAGDNVLKNVAKAMQGETRETDTVGRYGGEEFLILMPDTPQAGATVLAERIRAAVERLEVKGVDRTVTASLGVATYHGEDILDFISCADNRLYAAKNAGRNCVVSS